MLRRLRIKQNKSGNNIVGHPVKNKSKYVQNAYWIMLIAKSCMQIVLYKLLFATDSMPCEKLIVKMWR